MTREAVAVAACKNWRNTMAKGQLRSNKEAKKPKQSKKPTPPVGGISRTATLLKTPASSEPAKKK
ncbi:hypothetical protein [Paraburkholderia flava]|uniref:hypothetical protein n=1 Tax=Paraburkholderia flava TaxID=2547393 RepID=UPI00105BF388|nr:hypothetical protein [Paraburkholderia flava]